MLKPGGSLSIHNPPADPLAIRLSADGQTIEVASGMNPPVPLGIDFLKALLTMCGYIVMQRDEFGPPPTPPQ